LLRFLFLWRRALPVGSEISVNQFQHFTNASQYPRGGNFMRWNRLLLLAVTLVPFTKVVLGSQVSPYSGQESREIKALSKEEVDGYLSGDGMGLAKAAELNHYPGPKHVLDLAKQLNLSDEQQTKTQTIFDRMKSNAINLGKQLVEKERLLDTRFADGTISNDELEQLLAEISELQGKVRAVHLAEKLLLTPDQISRYDTLRGYQQPSDDDQHTAH